MDNYSLRIPAPKWSEYAAHGRTSNGDRHLFDGFLKKLNKTINTIQEPVSQHRFPVLKKKVHIPDSPTKIPPLKLKKGRFLTVSISKTKLDSYRTYT